MRLGKFSGYAACTTVMLLASPIAEGQVSDARDYDMPAQDLDAALRQVAAQSARPVIVASDLVAGLRAPALKGRFSSDDAVGQLLRGSGLRAVAVGSTLVVQRNSENVSAVDGSADDILVTGTRIRGHGPVGSPLVTIDRAAIDQSGFATTQQIAQSIPQNFLGGMNEATAAGGTLGQNTGSNVARG
jgi:hypothetical protein